MTVLQDAAMEPIQAVASVALSCGMGGVGWLPETNMTVGQLFTRELTEGFFYMGVGRGMGEAVDRAASQVPCSLGLLNGPVPSRILSPEAGLIGDSPPNIKELLGLNLEAADRLSGLLETHRRTGGELEGVELTFKRVRDGAEEKHAIIDGDTMHAIADGMTDSVPLRFILVNSPEAWKGPGHPEVRNGRGQMGALEAYWFLKDLSEMHDNRGRVVLYRTDAHRRPIATVLVQTKAGDWIDLNRAMVESGHAHVYIIMPDATGMSTEFVGLQQAAQREGIGIWQYPQYQGGLHISSVRTMRDEGLGGDQVMVRIFNTTDKALNLGDYKIQNGPREEPIPDFTLLPGQGVRLLLDSTEYNNNSNAEFVVGLMHDKPEGTPRFELDRDHPVLLVTRGTEERIATVFYSNGTAAERVPDGFKHQRAEGLHLIAFNPLQHISGFEDVKENIRLYNNSDEPIDVSHWALQQEGAVRLTLPEGTVLPPYRGVQIFTCSGKNRSDPAGDLELYLGETKKKQRIWNNDLPMNLINPAGEIISMEAGNAKARKLIPAKFLRRKGAVVPAGHESGDFATLIA
ncbi:MAG: thermonuclease family protein [Deltaproteobacteria bacterium]|nr:thermonuclease family protein [Deltaproteobacteria bacterium]